VIIGSMGVNPATNLVNNRQVPQIADGRAEESGCEAVT
jgi:hypothetical protein